VLLARTSSNLKSNNVNMTHKQQALVYQWVEVTSIILDINDSAKHQVNILAKMLGWVGGEEPWNTHWKECFDQDCIWRALSKR
jgi:hypothetical protein